MKEDAAGKSSLQGIGRGIVSVACTNQIGIKTVFARYREILSGLSLKEQRLGQRLVKCFHLIARCTDTAHFPLSPIIPAIDLRLSHPYASLSC